MISLLNADARRVPLADGSVHMVVTSPPYYSLRDYGIDGQIGLEQTPEAYIENMVQVFREVWRVLRDDGTAWLNLGDSYAGSGGAGGDYNEGGLKEGQPRYKSKFRPGSGRADGEVDERGQRNRNGTGAVQGYKAKDLMGIPWRVAFALQADGWYLRSDIIWAKPNPMPESVTDRPTKAHEYLFLLSKQPRYFYDADAVREDAPTRLVKMPDGWQTGPGAHGSYHDNGREKGRSNNALVSGRNRRTVWTIATRPYSGAHFATFPPDLVEPCIKAGTSERGVCPVCGSQWERVVEKEYLSPIVLTGTEEGRYQKGRNRNVTRMGDGVSVTTTGFRPTCDHDAEPIPAIVFDPFAGSGTTLMVARSLGRSAVGTDLSLDYLREQARTRLELDRLEAWESGTAIDGGEAGHNGHKNMDADGIQPGNHAHSFHAARVKDDGTLEGLPLFDGS